MFYPHAYSNKQSSLNIINNFISWILKKQESLLDGDIVCYCALMSLFWGHSCTQGRLCAEELVLMVFRDQILEIEIVQGSDVCKRSFFTTVPSP